MGNTRSELFEPVSVDLWWSNDQANKPDAEVQTKHNHEANPKANEDRMAEIREEISSLHEKRLRLIAEKKKEMDGLREEVARQKRANKELREFLQQKGLEPPNQEWDTAKVDVSLQTETFEVPGIADQQEPENQEVKTKIAELEIELGKTESIKEKNLEMQRHIAELQADLQGANAEVAAFENERREYKAHVIALKDIIAVSKQLLLMRESQIKELSQKVTEIEASLAEREIRVLSDDLRQEYERQLQNIKQLRALYEERQRADKTQMDSLKSQLDEANIALKGHETKNSELQERVDELEKENWKKYDTIIDLESQLGLTKAECSELKVQMSVINQLFSQILLGFNNGQEVDLDRLIKTLEENHDLLKDIVINEESNELSSALPKVLLDLINQVNATSKPEPQADFPKESSSEQAVGLTTIVEESESQTSTQQNSLSSASEIVQNLPKVWKVLTELLSHQRAPVSVLNENNDQGDKNPCYKSVQTPSGPTLVLSVSKTFIRLKNLIVEKKSLEKETTRLKQLNTHLETRLQDQEKRLQMVSHELSKTWNVVGKMQKQHQQLHTQEKILRYELAQKRKLLNELKEELEYCREKWLQAREKNSTTEEQWKQLRNEFAARKNTISEDLNNSVESGYSDERESSDDDIEDEAVTPDESPKTMPGCSRSSENLESENVEVCEIIGKVVEDLETDLAAANTEENGQGIVEVIQDEIAKIENGIEASGESLSAPPEDVNAAVALESNIKTNENNVKTQKAETSVEDKPSSSSTSSAQNNDKSVELDYESSTPTVLETNIAPLTTEPSTSENPEERQLNTSNSDENVIQNASVSFPIVQTSPEDKNVEETVLKELTRLENNIKSSRNNSETSSSTADGTCQVENPPREGNSEETKQLEVNDSTPEQNLLESQEEADKMVLKELIRLENNMQFSSSSLLDDICQPLSTFEQTENGLINMETELNINDVLPSQQNLAESAQIDAVVLNELIRLENNIRSSKVNLESLLSSTIDGVSQSSAEEETKNIVLNNNGSTAEVHSKETLKTDLVQNDEVQKDSKSDMPETAEKAEESTEELVIQAVNNSSGSVKISSEQINPQTDYDRDQESRRRDIDNMYKKLEEDILQTIRKTQSGEDYPSTSKQNRSTEEMLAAKEKRLKRLEEQSSALVSQAARTSHRSNQISSKLDSLHQQYSENSQNSLKNFDEALILDEPSTSMMKALEETPARTEEPSTSSTRTPEEILARREERLRTMEEQAQQLVRKALRNSLRGFHFCRKLSKLHDRYGESSESSDEAADDNNNNADGIQHGDETQNSDDSAINEAHLGSEVEYALREEAARPQQVLENVNSEEEETVYQEAENIHREEPENANEEQ